MTKGNVLLAIKFAISIGLIAYLISLIDLGAAKERIIAADLGVLALASAVLLFQTVIGCTRWWIVTRAIGARLPWVDLLRLFYIGGFFSQALPSSVGGDPIRMYMAYKLGQPLAQAINGVLLERVVTIIGLVILVAIVQPVFLPKLAPMQQTLMLTALTLLSVATMVGVVVLIMLDRLPESLSRFRIVRGLGTLAKDTRAILLHKGYAVISVILGVLTHVNISYCVYLIASALTISVTWIDCLVLMPPVLLVTTLPISIGGWGVREGAMVTAFALIGVSADAALVLSICVGICAIVVALPAGLIWLLGRSRGDVVSATEAAEAVETELSSPDETGPTTKG
jgi:uncharacterized protein (TIRG00374 family)